AGTVTFKTVKVILGTAVLDSTGHATFIASSLPTGSVTLFAVYRSDGNFLTSTGTTVEQVGRVASPGVAALAVPGQSVEPFLFPRVRPKFGIDVLVRGVPDGSTSTLPSISTGTLMKSRSRSNTGALDADTADRFFALL